MTAFSLSLLLQQYKVLHINMYSNTLQEGCKHYQLQCSMHAIMPREVAVLTNLGLLQVRSSGMTNLVYLSQQRWCD